jgi:outer membrane protein TolC
MKSLSTELRRLGAAALAGASLLVVRPAGAELPTLPVVIARARAHALVVADAEAELGVARGQLAGARVSSLGNPYSEIQVDRPFTDGAATGPTGGANREVQAMSFTYFPLDFAGQRGKRIAEAERLMDWKKLGIVDAQALATGDVVTAYGEYLVSWSRVEAATAGEATAREESRYFQGRFDAKDTTLYEKSIAEAEVARWVQAKAEAELRIANSRARLGQLTGIPEPEQPPPNASILPPPLRSSWDDAHLARVVERAPVISRINAEKTYWEASVERSQRERIPPLSLEVIAGRGGQGELRLGGGAVITFPVTRRYQGEIMRAESGRTNALRRLEVLRGILLARLRAARDAIVAINRALEELDRSGVPALERAVSASVEGFKAGKIDLTRAMLARRDLAIARARRLDLLEAGWRAYADLVIFSGEMP